MKKLISFTLCLVLALGLTVGSAFAISFTDQADILHKEAVNGCVERNIISGYADGSFRPYGSLTRAEMCKMLCVALNGGNAPLLSTTPSIFSDIESSFCGWADSYIAYCYNQKIVAGVGSDGKGGARFAPREYVTVDQAAKMLLVIMGYNPADYVGGSWAINVHTDASDAGLLKGLLTSLGSANLSRDDAAQMIWNALNANMVKWVTMGDTTYIQYLDKTLMEHCYPDFATPDNPTPDNPDTPDTPAWKQAYYDFIVKDAKETYGGMPDIEDSYSEYYLINIDDDDIPELYIAYGTSAYGEKLCTYHANSLTSLTLADSFLYYVPGSGDLLLSYGRMGVYWDDVYRLEAGRFNKTNSGFSEDEGLGENDERLNCKYYWNDEQVSEEEYEVKLYSAFDIDAAVSHYDETSYNYNEILQLLSE